jgi:hypothetical protein
MLEDMTKMKANHLAILKNKSEMITNKVILDVEQVLVYWLFGQPRRVPNVFMRWMTVI